MPRSAVSSSPAGRVRLTAVVGVAGQEEAAAGGRIDEAGHAAGVRGGGDPDTVPIPYGGPWPPSVRRRVLRALAACLPSGWRGARIDPGRPAATALALVAAAAATLAAVGVWIGRPQAQPVTGLPAVTVSGPAASAAAAPAPGAPPAGPLVVSVSGKVHRPGLVQVPDGARVADVLAAAGGPLPGADLAGLNLARKVGDGEQLAVGVPAPAPAGPAGTSAGTPTAAGASAAPGGKVDLNAATVDQLDALPGVGPVTAQRIVEWRAHNGRFARVDQLREVQGIGEHKFEQLRDLVTV